MASGELPFVAVFGDAATLETPRGGWTSDARHRWPVELGFWVGDATLEGLRLVAPEMLAPRRVEVFAAPGLEEETGDPLDDAFAMPRVEEGVTDAKRQKWRAEYCRAVFTRCGSIRFGESGSSRTSGDARERKVARLNRAARRTKFVRLVLHEPVRAPLPGEKGDGSRIGFARIALLGRGAEGRLPVRFLQQPRLDAAEAELEKAGVATEVIRALALTRVQERGLLHKTRATAEAFRADDVHADEAAIIERAKEDAATEEDPVLAALAAAHDRATKAKRTKAANALRTADKKARLADEAIRRSQETQRTAVDQEDFEGAQLAKTETLALTNSRRRAAARSLEAHDDLVVTSDRPASSAKPGSVFCHAFEKTEEPAPALLEDEDAFLDASQLERADIRDASDAVADVAAAARVAARRRARDQSTRDVFDEASYASSESDAVESSDDEPMQTLLNQTLGDDALATLKSPASGVHDWNARRFVGEASMPSASERGWWGFDEYPLAILDRPLDLDLNDDEERRPPEASDEDQRRDRARNALDRLLTTASVSARLVRWMTDNVSDLEGVADALAQMRAVRLSPPDRPPGADHTATDEDDDLKPSLEALLHKTKPWRRKAVSDALTAAIGPLALAFACQGNWLMRRQVLVLVRDGTCIIDGPALADAADALARAERSEDAERRGVEDVVRPEIPHPHTRRRRLLFAALCALLQQGLSSESADVFAEACRLLVDMFRGRKRQGKVLFAESPTYQSIWSDATNDDDDGDVLAPSTLLKRGIRLRGAPLREALVALRALLPLVAQRCARHCGEPELERNAHVAARRAARVAARCISRLARTPWLGAPLVAAAVLPRPPPCGAHVLAAQDRRAHASQALAFPAQPAKLAAARLRTLALLVARFGALPDSVLDARDIAVLVNAVLEQDPRPEVCRAASALVGALYAALVDAAAVARVSAGRDFSLVACNRDARRKLRRAFQNRSASLTSPTHKKSGLVRYTDPETGDEYLLDEKTGESRWAAAGEWAVDAKLKNVGQEILRRRSLLKAFGSPTSVKSETLIDDAATVADDDARLRRSLARVDAEMARRHGSAPSVAAEAKRLKKAAARHAAARSNAAADACTAARKARDAAADFIHRARAAVTICAAGADEDKKKRLEAILNAVCSRKLGVVWKAAFRLRLRAKYRRAFAQAFEAAEGASQTAGESLATVDIVTLRTACAAFHAQALDAEQAAQAAQAALDAARERREAARAARAAKPDGKVHPSDAKPAPAKKKGWFKKKK